MKKLTLFIGTIFLIILFSQNAHSQMIATITEDVETAFGIYHSIPVNVNPNVPAFVVEPDFSNVANFSRFEWTINSVDSTLFLQNHFTVKKGLYKQLYDIYNICTWDSTPLFVTSDAVLHIYHVLFDYSLSQIEIQKFVTTLNDLTEALIQQTESQMNLINSSLAKEAAKRNLAYLYVAKKLLNGDNVAVPDSVKNLVDSELSLISAHDGFHYSPILGEFSKLDYSQFQPRGHYTKNDTLKAYFKTMMWYGWTIFTLEPQKFYDLAKQHTLQSLMFVQMIYTLNFNNRPLEEMWDYIYEPTVFFVGKTDDPNIRDYRIIGEQIYGTDFLTLSPDSLANEILLNQFMTEAQKLPEPKIPNWIYGTFITYKGFRFMGQRFIPDSYMLAHLIDPYVSFRYMPKGLDVMTILGSDRAYALLDSVYQQTSFAGYTDKIAEFKLEFSMMDPKIWAQNLYWNWLYCLMPLLYEKGAGYPFFMQTLAWSDKELLTALASWAELRHDTILYAKQSMTPCCIPPGPPRSYVEPNPYLYARLASLVRFTRDGLQSRELLLPEYKGKLELFEELLLFLKKIAIKELENIPLTTEEYENIYCFGKVMQALVSVVKDPQNPWKMDADDMAIVADVHTDSNSDLCLEEGVGYPLEIFVIVNEGGYIRMTRGAIFSYYEFSQPIPERLTDETWRKLLVSEASPKMPEWASSFMDVKQSLAEYIQDSPDNLFAKEFTKVETQQTITVLKAIGLAQNYPNPFNPETAIRFELPKSAFVTIQVYNTIGQKIRTLIAEPRITGDHIINWDGKDDYGKSVSSGVYFYSLETGNFRQVKKMVLLR
jgi:hypothetical protein